jgi:hypothetical protein
MSSTTPTIHEPPARTQDQAAVLFRQPFAPGAIGFRAMTKVALNGDPHRHDGQRIQHLSASSYTKWVSCPEAWRRHYVLGERSAPSGAMFLGSRVDDALSAHHQHVIEHGDRVTLEQIHDCYRERWSGELDAEQDRLGVDWDEELGERDAFELGLRAIELAIKSMSPGSGDRWPCSESSSSHSPHRCGGRSCATSTSRPSGSSSPDVGARR